MITIDLPPGLDSTKLSTPLTFDDGLGGKTLEEILQEQVNKGPPLPAKRVTPMVASEHKQSFPSFDLVKPGKASFIIDGQYGSTGKGLIASWVAIQNKIDIAVTNAAPNAGHTSIVDDKKLVCFHLPTSGVYQRDTRIFIDAGAAIDVDLFLKEIEDAKAACPHFDPGKVMIHPRAAIVDPEDGVNEKNADHSVAQIAGTKKGVGSAFMRKLARKATLAGDDPRLKPYIYKLDLNRELAQGAAVLVEVPQGFGLGINSGFAYPHCTSRDVTVGQAMADAGIHPSFMGKTLMALRTYPIRVGHVFNEDGSIKENSGPIYPDQVEVTFGELGVPEERTTVTQRVRRIFTWSDTQFFDAATALRPDYIFLNFVNYFKHFKQCEELFERMSPWATHKNTFFGIGPKPEDIYGWNNIQQMIHRMEW